MNKEICIVCPRGCLMQYEYVDGKLVVTDNHCKRGPDYLAQELTRPKRMLTTTMKVLGGDIDVVAVHSSEYVDKGDVFEIIKELKKITLKAPIKCNEVLVDSILGKEITIKSSKEVKCIHE